MREFPSRWRRVPYRGFVLVAVVASLVVFALGSTGAIADTRVELPGGKSTYVVSQASLVADSRNNNSRLATYVFNEDGTVAATGWYWSQTQPTQRQRTGALPDDSCASGGEPGDGTDLVQQCYMLTAGGFTAAGNDDRSGTYTVDSEIVTINWGDGDWTESWSMTASDDNSLIKMELEASTASTHGFAYGSNADPSTRVSLGSMPDHPEPLIQDMYTWANDNVGEALDGVLQHDQYRRCVETPQCVTYLQPSSSNACQQDTGCPNYGGGTEADVSSIQYYMQAISSKDRRDTFWHWCTCLAMERDEVCYKGNSHVKPMLQIIDDDGRFHGWVGVEASFYPGDDEPRRQDMLGTFRITDFS